MTMKKVAFGSKPNSKLSQSASSEAWVTDRAASASEASASGVKMKRLTIDIPEHLHRKIKSDCANRGSKIADEVRELLLQKYGNT
jgi:hypothetical protein